MLPVGQVLAVKGTVGINSVGGEKRLRQCLMMCSRQAIGSLVVEV